MYISSMGKKAFFSGGDFLVFLGGWEVGPVVTNKASGGGCLLIREILKILQSHRRVAGGEQNVPTLLTPHPQMINNKRPQTNKPKQKTFERLKNCV